jgi:hypothetical protein
VRVAGGAPFASQKKVSDVNRQPPRVEAELKKQAEALGVEFIRTDPKIQHLKDIEGHSPDSLRRLGQGMKVAIEVIMQAVEVGFVEKGRTAIGVGGTSRGCNMAIVARAADPENLSDLWGSEILAKPL